MRLAIISDTHMGPGRRHRLPGRCEELIAGSDLLVHAGDVMTLEALAEIEAIGPPVRAVTGNMDGWDLRRRLPDMDEIDVEGVKLAVVHDAGPAAGRGHVPAQHDPHVRPRSDRAARPQVPPALRRRRRNASRGMGSPNFARPR
jgi:putative phosphoesterase